MRHEQDLLNRRKQAMLSQLTSLSALAAETAENLPEVPELDLSDLPDFRATIRPRSRPGSADGRPTLRLPAASPLAPELAHASPRLESP